MSTDNAHDAAEAPTMPIDVGSPYSPPAGPNRPATGSGPWKWIALVVAAVAVAAVAVVFLLTRASDEPAEAGASSYAERLTPALEPVIEANRRVSDALSGLNVRQSVSARRAVRSALTTVATARGAVNTLDAEPDDEQLASQARQTLSREATYLGVVRSALGDPSGPSVGQVQTQAGNLRDALDVVAPAGADWGQSVYGADNVPAWARRNAADRRRARQESDSDGNSAAASQSSGGSAPATTTTDCGSGLRAGPNTSCAFAQNVRDAYNEAPGLSPTVEVYSPTTGRTYTMSCSPAGSGTTCSGGNNASVSF